jgi:hypothetical protein
MIYHLLLVDTNYGQTNLLDSLSETNAEAHNLLVAMLNDEPEKRYFLFENTIIYNSFDLDQI